MKPQQGGIDPSCCRMLVSDIDGTLLENGEASVGLATLRILLGHHRDVLLVYATGRSFVSTCELVRSGVLPAPDAIAAFVGTEVWLPPWQFPESRFARELTPGWDRMAILEKAADLPALQLQSSDYQTRFKVSFFLEDAAVVPHLARALARCNVRARFVYSSNLYLDVLPVAAGKRGAVEYLRRLWGVRREHVLTCGDSANDYDMLAEPSFLSVAVGNAHKEVARSSAAGSLYNAQLPFAAGVLEGAEVFDFWPS
jgi:sucrose-6F-phosphate phosphohydrolase